MSEVTGYLWLLLLALLQYLRGYGLFVEVKGYLWLSLLTLLQYIRDYGWSVACGSYGLSVAFSLLIL